MVWSHGGQDAVAIDDLAVLPNRSHQGLACAIRNQDVKTENTYSWVLL